MVNRLKWGVGGILGVAVLTGGVMIWGTASGKDKNAGPSISSQVAAMALRLYPSGSQAVVICSGIPGHSQDLVAAQILANRVQGPLLVAQGVDALGNGVLSALKRLSVPQASTNIQPYQASAGKPSIYVVGGTNAIGAGIVAQLTGLGYHVTRLGGNAKGATVKVVQNWVAPSLPSGNLQGFPANWTTYAGKPSHNAFFPATKGAPAWETKGVAWNYAEAAAIPLHANFPDLPQLGLRGAPVKMTQNLGNSVGVTAVGGIVYAESDDYHLYAVKARTGQLLWKTGTLVNNLMGNPIVSHGLVIATAGDTGFPFSQVLKYDLSGGKASLVRGLMYSAIYAFNARTGRLVWRHDFHGNAMPSPAVVGNTVYEATGGGNLWAFNVTTGQRLWKQPLGGFDSMSSANYWTNPKTGQTEILVGTSAKNHVAALNAKTGKVIWTQSTALNIFNTGMGDNTPSVDQKNGIVVQDSVVNFNKANKTCNLAVYAMNAATGHVLWSTKLGRGQAPPAYKAGVSMIHNGVVYVGSPVTSTLYALSEKTGQKLWQFSFSGAGPAGAGRGNAVYACHTLWVAAGPKIYALNPSNGHLVGSYQPGGRFGIVNPVIVGSTLYVDNSYDWVQAIPLKKIDPAVQLP